MPAVRHRHGRGRRPGHRGEVRPRRRVRRRRRSSGRPTRTRRAPRPTCATPPTTRPRRSSTRRRSAATWSRPTGASRRTPTRSTCRASGCSSRTWRSSTTSASATRRTRGGRPRAGRSGGAVDEHAGPDSIERSAGRDAGEAARQLIGRMTGLTLFTPVRRRWVPVLRPGFWLGKYVPLAQKHILQFDFIHFVRWTIVRELPTSTRPSARSSTTATCSSRATSTGPGSTTSTPSPTSSPTTSASSGAAGIHFPYPPPAEPLKAWIARNSMEGGHYYCAYPHASTRMCKGALEVRERLPEAAAPTPSARAPRSSRPPTSASWPTTRRTSDGRVAQPRRRRLRADDLRPDHRPATRTSCGPTSTACRWAPTARWRACDTLHLSRIQIFDQLVAPGPEARPRPAWSPTTSCSPAASTATSTPTST